MKKEGYFLDFAKSDTAQANGMQAAIFPDMAHDMMLEAGWQAVADRILIWLEERGL